MKLYKIQMTDNIYSFTFYETSNCNCDFQNVVELIKRCMVDLMGAISLIVFYERWWKKVEKDKE